MKSVVRVSAVPSAVLCFLSSAVAHASGLATQAAFPEIRKSVDCADYISEKGNRLLRFPGLDSLVIEEKFDAGFETWFSGTIEGTGHFSGSYSGSSFFYSEEAGTVQSGLCTDLGIFGDTFTLR